MRNSFAVSLEVWGDFACFTRSEFKIERVSYDVITPSAARGIFEAIYWKPEIHYQIESIELLKPIRWHNFRRNEVSVVSNKPFFIEECRSQRSSLLLRDVGYRLHAHIQKKTEGDESLRKHLEMFQRRLQKGQCVYQPYLGCREFSAFFSPINEKNKVEDFTRDFGYMFYDYLYSDKGSPTPPQPAFFAAKMSQGNMLIPDWNSEDVRR